MHINASILPFVAHALAMLPECRSKIDEIYNAKRAVYYAAAMRSPDRSCPILASGRAEHQVVGLRVLGILSSALDTDDQLTLRRLLRSAAPEAYDWIYKYRMQPSARQTYIWCHNADPDRTDSDVTWTAYVIYFICANLKVDQNDEIKKIVTDYTSHVYERQVAPLRPTEVQEHRARDLIKKYGRIDVDSLYGDIGEALLTEDEHAQLDSLHVAANLEGIDLSDYAAGVGLNRRQLALCLLGDDPARELERATLMCVIRAARLDRDFCLQLYREDRTLDYDAAVSQRDQAVNRARAAEERADRAEKALLAAQERDGRQELADLQHRAKVLEQELASLREALYQMAEEQAGDVPAEDLTREIPAGIVSVGGHPDWARRMAELVPGGTFFSAEVTVSPDAIRGAEELWIQPLYMSHKQYEPVIETARRYGVPVYYYPSTGAERCRQVMREIK